MATVSQKRIKLSLTLRIFIITFAMLLLASLVTYAFLAYVTPTYYTSISISSLEQERQRLVDELNFSSHNGARELIRAFQNAYAANVVVLKPDGNIDEELSNIAPKPTDKKDYSLAVIESYEIAGEMGAASEESVDIVSYGVAIENGFLTEDVISSRFSFSDREGVYTLNILPQVHKENDVVEAFRITFPWLLLTMFIFSALCSFFYSRFITKPIVRLSGISQSMADMDFSLKCGESRNDEIGTLGRNLDVLSSRLGTALEDLRTANAALERDIEIKRERETERLAFFSAVSHELKTPITVLKGQLTGMLDNVDIYRDRDKYLARSLEVTGRMEGLVMELLTIARLETVAAGEESDISLLINKYLDFYEDICREKAITLNIAIADSITVNANARLLSKVIDNILSNAVFYSPKGACVSVLLEKSANIVSLTVENSGVSIPEDAFPHLFSPFFRVEKSRSRETGGSGLGLYLVKLILDRQGASYSIENTADGVRFTVSFST